MHVCLTVLVILRPTGQYRGRMALRIPTTLKKHCVRSLAESLDGRTMIHFIKEIFPGYDIYKRTGFPRNLPIQALDMANQIVSDVITSDLYLSLVEHLIKVEENGIMGRRYTVPLLREIIKGTYELGFAYDSANQMFVENSNQRRTENWGVLRDGEEYQLAFLAIDIAGNSRLVRTHTQAVIRKTYKDLRGLVSSVIDKRNGRFWNWEGDGGLVAFFLGDKHTSAVLSGMEIIHELFIYNRTARALKEPLSVRIAVHSGSCRYSANKEHLNMLETVTETYRLEKTAEEDSVNISAVVKVMLDAFIAQHLRMAGKDKSGPYRYSLALM